MFEGLVSQAQKARESQDNNGPIRRQELSDQSGWKYRKCPTCHEMMARRNYGRRSGVIVDICRAHGIWFDPDELPQILRWIKQGGLSESNRRRIGPLLSCDSRAF